MPARRHLVADLRASAPVWALPPEHARRLRDAGPADWRVTVVESPTVSDGDGGGAPSAEVLAAVRDAEVYVGFGIARALFAAAPELRWVQSTTAGVGGLLFPELVASPVVLTNAAGVHAVPVAETVLAGVLALLRGLDVAADRQRARSWDRSAFVGAESTVRELGECRVLVIGAGGVGGAVAERCAALGAECTGVRRRPERGAPPGFARVVGPDAIERELPRADVVVIAAPATGETRGLLTAARLDLLPAGAIVVNVGRGSLVDEGALVERVRDGRLRGAALDVFAEEPLPTASPLWGEPSVLITPHVAAVSPRRFWDRAMALVLDNWARYRAGEPLRNTVDKFAGY